MSQCTENDRVYKMNLTNGPSNPEPWAYADPYPNIYALDRNKNPAKETKWEQLDSDKERQEGGMPCVSTEDTKKQ